MLKGEPANGGFSEKGVLVVKGKLYFYGKGIFGKDDRVVRVDAAV